MNAILKFPDHAKVWVYQANRELTYNESTFVRTELSKFLKNWEAHGQPLKSQYSVFKNLFVILAVDEESQAATGCSIDASVKKMKEIGDILGVDFTDRSQIAFLEDDNLKLYPSSEVPELIADGAIQPDSMVYNNTPQTVGEWKNSWLLPASESWLKRYF